MELLEIYDINRKKTGKVKERHSVLQEGEFIIGVRAIIIKNNKILLTRRSINKKVEPLKWECNGGAVDIGETSIEAMKREIIEELGLCLEDNQIRFYKTIKRENEFTDVYIIFCREDIDDLKFQDGEVDEAKFVDFEEYLMLKKSNQLVSNEPITEVMVKEVLKNIKL